MKQKVNNRDLGLLMQYDQRMLSSDLECDIDQLEETITIGNLTEVIRKYHQMTIYTVDSAWCIQLFDADVAANDEVDCIYENNRPELIDVLYITMAWIYDHLRNATN